MQAETRSPGTGRGASITGIVVAYGIKYLAGGLLAFTILATFAALILIYLTVVGEEMPWLQYISFLLPLDETGSGTLNEADILRVYAFLATIGFLLSEGYRRLKRLVTRKAQGNMQQGISFGRYILRSFMRGLIVISGIFGLAAIVLPFSAIAGESGPLSMYLVLGSFYGTAVFFYVIFSAIDHTANLVISMLKSRLHSHHP